MSETNIVEGVRNTPIVGRFDVVVSGAGPAGVSAALAAARAGAKTLILEQHGCLGGIWTAGVLGWVIDSSNKQGLMQEIIRRLDERGARAQKGRNFAFDVEEMKVLLEEMCVEAGVTIRLHTRIVSSEVRDVRLHAVVTESRSGREAFVAHTFIDTTGDGDLAALSGCGFDYGHPESGRAQPMSLVGLVTGVEAESIAPFVGGGVAEAKVNLLQEFKRAGVTPSYGAPTLFPIRNNFFGLVANHEYGVSPMDADQVTQATVQARRELSKLVRALRSLGGAWSGIRIVATGAQIGVREGRRIHGRYRITAEDLYSGKKHPDAICRANAGIDVHSIDPERTTSYSEDNKRRVLPYDIPLRALIAADVDGLMMAGRCISGDFFAHSSYRMTGNAVAMGEAAGLTCALAVKGNVLPHEVQWQDLAEHLPTGVADFSCTT